MGFCASWQLPKFLFQGNDSQKNVVSKVFIRHTDAKVVLYELFFESVDCQQTVA